LLAGRSSAVAAPAAVVPWRGAASPGAARSAGACACTAAAPSRRPGPGAPPGGRAAGNGWPG